MNLRRSREEFGEELARFRRVDGRTGGRADGGDSSGQCGRDARSCDEANAVGANTVGADGTQDSWRHVRAAATE